MVWIPGVNELPMSVMVSDTPDQAALTVRKRGESSTALYNPVSYTHLTLPTSDLV